MAKLELHQQHRDEAVGPVPVDPGRVRVPVLERIARQSPERLTDQDKAVLARARDLGKQRTKYLKEFRSYVNRSNAHLAAIQTALRGGVPVPKFQFDSYPVLNGWCANNGVTPITY